MRCAAYMDSAALVARRSTTAPPMCWVSVDPCKVHGPEFSGFDHESPQQVGGGERGRPVAIAGGDLAHHANAARDKE